MRTKLNRDESRQGVTGRHVRLVLAISLIGAIVAMIAVWSVYF